MNGNGFSGDRRPGNRLQRPCPGRIIVIPEIILSVRLRVPRLGHDDAASCVVDVDRAAEKAGTPAIDSMDTKGVSVTIARAEIFRDIPGSVGDGRSAS